MDLFSFAAGLALGLMAGGLLYFFQRRKLDLQFRQDEKRMQDSAENLLASARSQFAELSAQALRQTHEDFLKMAGERMSFESSQNKSQLDHSRSLIEQQLKNINKELCQVTSVVQTLEKDREKKFGELTSQLALTGMEMQKLHETTGSLREALASSRARGVWGERMAEDVLRMAGLVEGISYSKQRTQDCNNRRPDFTFNLPGNKSLNMDVKFPLDNYWRFLQASSDAEKQQARKTFLSDVKARIKECLTREYISPENNTVDYMLLFIPNDSIYAFIHESDASILDEAMGKKVILCSPVTLYAVLAVIRQAIDNFALKQASSQIFEVLLSFQSEWDKFCEYMQKVDNRMLQLQSEWSQLSGTRKNKLTRQLDKIESVRCAALPAGNLD